MQLSGAVERVTSSQEGSSCDIRYKGHIPPQQGYVFSLKWMPIHDRIKFHKVTMVYKSVTNLAPNYMKNMFTYVRDSHSCTTRSSGKYKELYIQRFANSGDKIWNSINPYQNLSSFKTAYIKDYFSV